MPNNVKKIGVKQSDGTYISEDIGVDYSNVDGLDTEAVAFKAKKDLQGNDITDFFRDGSLSGSSLVLTRGSGSNPKSIAIGMQGATSGDNGAAGLVPAPAIGDQVKFLRGDGTWQEVESSSGLAYVTDEILVLTGDTPTTVLVTLTLNGAKNDIITIKDSANITVGSCTFDVGQTSGTVQISVPVGGGNFKFVSAVAKDIVTLTSDYEKIVSLSDALSQTVNVYPKYAFYWYGNDINNITHDGYTYSGYTTYAANKSTNYVEFTQSSFQLMGTANAIDFTPFNALHFIIESNISTATTGGGLNTTKTSISAGGNLSKYADFPGSNNAKADVELDVSSINQSAYIFMVDGSNTAHSCKVYAIFGESVHENDLTIHGAKEDAITIKDTNDQTDLTIHGAKEDAITIKDTNDQTVATCIFESGQTVGYVSKALLPPGTYKFISSVAKGITEGTKNDNYEKIITLNGSETEIMAMPDGCIYWFGNEIIPWSYRIIQTQHSSYCTGTKYTNYLYLKCTQDTYGGYVCDWMTDSTVDLASKSRLIVLSPSMSGGSCVGYTGSSASGLYDPVFRKDSYNILETLDISSSESVYISLAITGPSESTWSAIIIQ